MSDTERESSLAALKLSRKELARLETRVHRLRVFVSDQQESLEHAKDAVREQINLVEGHQRSFDATWKNRAC